MSFITKLWRIFTEDIGIDLGTANTKVALAGKGIVAAEPSVVAIDQNSGRILAVGLLAKKMLGRTPSNIVALRPLKDGVISEFNATREMISYFIDLAQSKSSKGLLNIQRPRVVIGVPSLASEIGRKAVYDAARSAGAREVFVIEEPMAAAIGSGLPVNEAEGSMIVDIGGGTTDIAIISLGGIVVDKTIPVAGDKMDEEIVKYMRHKYNLLIGERMAEDLKIKIGSAYPLQQELVCEISGRDVVQGVPKTLVVSSVEVREAILPRLLEIVNAISDALEEAPPEILADLSANGIVLAGGGALIRGIKDLFEDKLRMRFIIADNPIECVVKGTQILLDDIDLLEKVNQNFV